MKLFSFAASLAVLATQTYALFETVEKLDQNNFQEMVSNDDDHLWMVTFYADWCPYCEPFSPELEAAQKDTALADKKIKFGAVNVMENRDLTMQYGVSRSPSVKIFGKDKATPEDYTGHRKRTELVEYLNNYASTNDYVVVPEVPETKYDYNIKSIVQDISKAHSQRIATAEAAHNENIATIGQTGYDALDVIRSEYDGLLQQLVADRTQALTDSKAMTKGEFADADDAHKVNINTLDQEAIDTINAIVESHKNDGELTDFIPTLEKDWFTIVWDDYNRRMKPEPQPVDPYYGDQHAAAGVYGDDHQQYAAPGYDQQGYGSYGQETYGGYGQQQAYQPQQYQQQVYQPQAYQQPQYVQQPVQQYQQAAAYQPAQGYQAYAPAQQQQPQNQYSAAGYGQQAY